MKRLTLLGPILMLLLVACGGSEPALEPTAADIPETTATESTSRISSADFIATVTAAAAPTDQSAATDTPAAPPSPTPEATPYQPSSTPDPTSPASPTAEPESTDESGSIAIVEVRAAPPGQTASLTVEVAPGTACTLAYTTPSGTESQAAGLGEATAGDDGRITWEWVIGSRTNPGEGTIQVRCGDATETRPMTIE